MDLELADKVVLITGGSDGLGLALAAALVKERATVVICGRDERRLSQAADHLAIGPGGCIALQADVTDPSSIERLVATIEERCGRLDGLVNNAGRSAAAMLVDTTDQEWIEDLDLKVHAHVRLIRRCLPLLERSPGASILNVLAIAGKAPGPGSLPTSVSRAASLALTKALSKELGVRGIRVNAVLIGLVESGQWARLADASGMAVQDLYEQMATGAGIPLGRVGRAEEFADVASFLLSSRSSYLTGVGINVDGGMSPVP